ncbi:MAG: hypothetical protein LBF37_03255 [Rickettsiales bacterium]|jgi:hypothetical protein|nr:hypothetical protein [Rickettsiales bacterium]
MEIGVNMDKYRPKEKLFYVSFLIPDPTTKSGIRRKHVLVNSPEKIAPAHEFPNNQIVLLRKNSVYGSDSLHLMDMKKGEQFHSNHPKKKENKFKKAAQPVDQDPYISKFKSKSSRPYRNMTLNGCKIIYNLMDTKVISFLEGNMVGISGRYQKSEPIKLRIFYADGTEWRSKTAPKSVYIKYATPAWGDSILVSLSDNTKERIKLEEAMAISTKKIDFEKKR